MVSRVLKLLVLLVSGVRCDLFFMVISWLIRLVMFSGFVEVEMELVDVVMLFL